MRADERKVGLFLNLVRILSFRATFTEACKVIANATRSFGCVGLCCSDLGRRLISSKTERQKFKRKEIKFSLGVSNKDQHSQTTYKIAQS